MHLVACDVPFRMLVGELEILVLVGERVNEHAPGALQSLRERIAGSTPAGVLVRVLPSAHPDRDEAAFRMGGMRAVDALYREDGT